MSEWHAVKACLKEAELEQHLEFSLLRNKSSDLSESGSPYITEAMTTEERIEKITSTIKIVPDFPKPGIGFRDIFPILKNPDVFKDCIDLFVEHINKSFKSVDVIVGLDSRGFLFGPMIAQQLHIAFIPIRKAGKLPGEKFKTTYKLEYGEDSAEMQKDAVSEGQKVIIFDDVLATGGTLQAAVTLLKQAKADILECLVLLELSDLQGKARIDSPVFSLIQVTGD